MRGTPNRVHAICSAGLLMLSKARRMSHEETRHAVWVSLACSSASISRREALSVPWLARNPCCDGSSRSCVSQAVRMRYVRMLVHSLRKISSRQIGRRSLMLLSSVVLGRGMSQRCFQNSGMCWVGQRVQSIWYVALWRSSGRVFRCRCHPGGGVLFVRFDGV